jgi:hypothetical protein
MYLARVPVTTIQLIGRWKSDTFMRYIREQEVDCFTQNVSSKMLTTKNFYTIPNKSLDQRLNQCPVITKYGPNLLETDFNSLIL